MGNMNDEEATSWAAVFDRTSDRRTELGMSQRALAEATGLSDTTLRKMRDGVPIARAENRRQLEMALEWEPGSIDAILDGREPTPTSEGGTDDDVRAAFAEARELARELRELLPLLAEKLQPHRE